MIHNEPIAIVVAALFLPFLSQVLAVSFGVWSSVVAGAVQFAVFPVWFGRSLVIGMPSGEVIWSRLLRFSINLLTICISGALAYATLHATP